MQLPNELRITLLVFMLGYVLFEVCGAVSYSLYASTGRDSPFFTSTSMLGLVIMVASLLLLWRAAVQTEKEGGMERPAAP